MDISLARRQAVRRSVTLLLLFALAHLGHHLLNSLTAPLLPMIRDDFALDYTKAGVLLSAFSLSYGIAQLPGGWLADRLGPRLLIAISISGVALGGLFVGLSQSFLMMAVFMVLMGVLGGGYHPASPPLISASVDAKNRGTALGVHVIGGSASFALAPLFAVAVAAIWGWRASFIALAIPAMAFGVVFYLLLGRWSPTMVVAPEKKGVGEGAAPASGRRRRLVAFIFLSTFVQSVISAAVAFVPLFLVDHYGVGKGTAGAFISLVYFAGLWAGLLGGFLSDRLGRVPLILAVGFAAGPLVYLVNVAPYGVALGAVLLAIGVLQYVRMPVSESYIVGQTGERNRSMILAIYYFGAMEGGAVLTPAMGYSIDRLGFQTSLAIGAVAVFAVTVVCSLFLWGSRD